MALIRLQTLSFASGNYRKRTTLLPNLDSLPETITAPRTDAVYNCHSYLTKVPVAAIRPFIEMFSAPGETIVDFFAGSGMTGLAAVAAGRKAQLSDISVLGQHIATGYLTEVSPSLLRTTASSVTTTARVALGDLYQTQRASDGSMVELTRTVWSFTYRCPACSDEIVYYDHLSPSGAPPKVCPSCSGSFARRIWSRGEDVPVEVVVHGENGRLTPQPVSTFDRRMIKAAAADSRQKEVPSLSITEDREMYSRSGLGKAGLTETARFFSPRNAIALLELWRAINAVSDEYIKCKLRFAFTAILPRASRRYQWSAQRPLNAQNQTYYIAPVYYEWNVFELFDRKIEAAVRADDELFGSGREIPSVQESPENVSYEVASADQLAHLKDAAIDYVFTDPPFGSNIFYSDMSLFHEAWLGRTTDQTSEAVMHTTGKRKKGAEERYAKLLHGAFSEAFRILKPGRYMSVVFGNSNGRIWGLVQRALRDAGFKAAPVHVAILDKGQRSVKGLSSGSEGVVTVDLILTVQKPVRPKDASDALLPTHADATALIHQVISEISGENFQSPSYVYAHVLRRAIQKHLLLDDLHLSDALILLRKAGYMIDPKTGLLYNSNAESRAA